MSAIELENVDIIYQTDTGTVRALNSLSMNIKSGSWSTIIGRNGSGKSTLARVLAQLLPVSRGKVRIMGATQMVFQNPEAGLIGETVFEDVAFGLSVQQVPASQIREKVEHALRPFGLHKWIDKPVAALSGGQKQLLCIASCLALNPDIFIFDECTSMLDEQSRQTVRQSVRGLLRAGSAKTVIWLTQHLEELSDADTVFVLENGNLAWQGAPRAFFYAGPDASWCRTLGFTPPYVVQVAEHLQRIKGRFDGQSGGRLNGQLNELLSGQNPFDPLTVAELVQGRSRAWPSN
jgi:energy-coupling factor transport system ATP-binding protein